MTTAITSSARTDAGRVRAVNEDSYLAGASLFVVADGMGGHARGERASGEAVRVLAERLGGTVPAPGDVLDALTAANQAVRALSSPDDQGAAVAGTTLAAAVLVRVTEGTALHWMLLNVGDSRIYTWDGRTLDQVSVDHSAVQELIDAGVISAAQATRHPERNVITRALGAADRVDPDVWLLPAVGTQRFLVCSDGLTKELSDDQIAGVLAAGDRSSDPAEALVAAAIDAGGRDNVTAIVVESRLGGTRDDVETTLERADAAHGALEDTRPRT